MIDYLKKVNRFSNGRIIINLLAVSIVFMAADAFDIFTQYLSLIGIGYGTVIAFFLFILISIKIDFFRWIKTQTVASPDVWIISIDGALLCVLLIQLFFAGIEAIKLKICLFDYLLNLHQNYKIVSESIVIVFLQIMIICRSMRLSFNTPKSSQRNNYSLKDMYEGSFDNNCGGIFIDDTPAKYDLLNRERIIDAIVRNVKTCAPEKKFVMAICGKWGSGKTTILNNAVSKIQEAQDIKDKPIIVDDFSPWNYDNSQAMISALIDAIFSKLSGGYNELKIQEWKSAIVQILFDSNSFSKSLSVLIKHNHNETISTIKESMNFSLETSGRSVVVILDNIERMDSKTAVMLLRTVTDILDLNHVIYILSYDKDRMNELLAKEGIDKAYLKKIVQMECNVPDVLQSDITHILTASVNNLLIKNNWDKEQTEDLIAFVRDNITEELNDLRDVIRYINSVISPFIEDNKDKVSTLDIKDKLGIKTIEFINNDLYYYIKKNKSYFVSDDRSISALSMDESILSFNSKLEEKAKKQRFDEFEIRLNKLEYRNTYKLLSHMFPYVCEYLSEKEDNSTVYIKPSHQDAVIDGRIFNGRYFDLFFMDTDNFYSTSKEIADEFISTINKNDYDKAENIIRSVANNENIDIQRVFAEIIQLHVGNNMSINWSVLVRLLYEYVEKFNNQVTTFVMMTARERIEYIISLLLSLDKIDKVDLDSFLLLWQQDYGKLDIISEIYAYLKRDVKRLGVNSSDKIDISNRITVIEQAYHNLVDYVVNKRVDIYSDEYYRIHNIKGIYYSLKERNKADICLSELNYLINGKTLYRFIWDFSVYITNNQGEYNYYIDVDFIQKITTVDTVSKLLDNNPPISSIEGIIAEIWRLSVKNYQEHPDKGDFMRDVYKEHRILNFRIPLHISA